MIFNTLGRWKRKTTKESVAESSKLVEQMVKEGGKVLGIYWTLGRYVPVLIMEAKDEKAAMKGLLRWGRPGLNGNACRGEQGRGPEAP